MSKNRIYNDEYYKNRNAKTMYTAQRILEIALNVFEAKSAVDFGCGVGAFLAEFTKQTGSNDVLGLDGDYVNLDYLEIDKSCFLPYDLSKDIHIDRKFDMAISLEVAEHLPASRAQGFVDDICSVSDICLFSAACKMQGGEGHVNEQPLSYWKELFYNNGYELIDIVRQQIWEDSDIPAWYRQNVVLFIKREMLENCNITISPNQITNIIHPELYEVKSKIFDKIVASPIFKFQHWLHVVLVKMYRKIRRKNRN